MVKPYLSVVTTGRYGNTHNKDLGKVFAHNSHDFLCVRYEIRQTYAVCLILLFIQRFADVVLSLLMCV
jgi:hypothetical protein